MKSLNPVMLQLIAGLVIFWAIAFGIVCVLFHA